MSYPSPEPTIARDSADGPRRVVLLGASNLTKGIATVLETAHAAWGRPLDVLCALGHGRSYGRESRVFGRSLPGILPCRLWPALAAQPNVPTAALVTDIGNDILYGETAQQIADWVEMCLDRLADIQARTVLTLLPVENLDRLSPTRFRLARTMLFPYSRVTLAQVHDIVHELNERLRQMAAERGCALVSHRAAWYGFDPVHIKRGQRPNAWGEILSNWNVPGERLSPARGSLARELYLRSRTPDERCFLGIAQRGRQPAARLRDGTTIALY